MANRLADIHQVAPKLTDAVARRITSGDLHEKAQRDLGAFVHRTVIEDERTYAVRIDDGAMLDAAEQIEHARAHLTPAGRQQLAGIHDAKPDKLDTELDALSARARTRALTLRITPEIRDRARTGRNAFYILLDFGAKGIPVRELDSALGLYLWAYAIFSAGMFVASLRTTGAVALVFLLLTITFILLGIGNSGASSSTIHLGGYLGLATAIAAWYAAFAGVISATFGRSVLPVFPLSGR